MPTRLLAAALLGLVAAVAALGLWGAFYTDWGRTPPPTIAASAPLPAEPVAPPAVLARDPTTAAAAPAAPPTTEPRVEPPALARLEPQAGPPPVVPATPEPPLAAPVTPVLQAALPPPTSGTAMPPAIPAPQASRAEPAYWVEYAVFAGEPHAERFRQSLAEHGIESVVTRTHTPGGRSLWRVRSAGTTDLNAARTAAKAADGGLKLAALVHRQVPAAAPETKPYWVQFGTFAKRPAAVRLKQKLARQGIAATVTTARGTAGKPLFLVRSDRLPDRQTALLLAKRASLFAETLLVAGHDRPRARLHHPRGPPPTHHIAALR